MPALAAAAGARSALHFGIVLTAFGFGFRHGIDWDHIAALADITSSQATPRRSMWFATLYALGHAFVVFMLGLSAIVLAQRLPEAVDAVMERLVGATLVILGLYVFHGVLRHGRDFRMHSRWILVFSGARRGVGWIRRHVGAPAGATPEDHRHRHQHVVPMPDDPFGHYEPRSVFCIGMIHGIGAETPTQLLIFLTAAGVGEKGVGEKGVGLFLLVAFLFGLLLSNAAVACTGTLGFLGATRNCRLYLCVACITALFSLVIGTVFLSGSSALLPAMLGG